MEQLLDYPAFHLYFESLCKKTHQMNRRKVLRIQDDNALGLPMSSEIVAQASVQSKFLNEMFFYKEFGNVEPELEIETQAQCKNYPIDIQYFRLDWILNTEEGFSFLQALHKTDNLSLFSITSVQLFIDFLYKRFKFVILSWLFPVFLLQLFFFYLMSHLNEISIMNQFEDGEYEYQGPGGFLILVVIINIIISGY